MKESILGFDVRVVGKGAARLWDAERRKIHLLVDVAQPLSMDVMVWSSAFVSPTLGDQFQLAWVARPDWVGPNDPLWDDLGVMLARFKDDTMERVFETAVIAVTWITEDEFQSGLAGPYLEPTIPAIRAPDWDLLGYDVADGAFSGLTNCGYGQEHGEPRSRWASKLNEHHLLRTVEDAFEFKRYTDQRVPEHAPFSVFGLWRIPVPDAPIGAEPRG